VTEQTLSSAVKKLELELGCPLLVRSKQGVEPTAEGRILLERGQRVLADLDDALTCIRDGRSQREKVRVYLSTLSVPETDDFSVGALDAFVQARPDVDVVVSEAPTQWCLQALRQDEGDLAFVYCWPQVPELEPHLLFEGRVVLALSERHPLAARDTVSFADLRGETFLSAGDEARGKKMILKRCREHGYEPVWRTVPSLFYLKSVADGKGVALALDGHPLLATTPGVCAKRLAPEDDFTLPLALVVRRGCNQATRDLLEHLLAAWTPSEPKAPGVPTQTA
jgi:DNA-binding transcriptional LysR family regulator